MFIEAIKLMGVGVGTVFAVLALFFGLVKLLLKLFPKTKDEED